MEKMRNGTARFSSTETGFPQANRYSPAPSIGFAVTGRGSLQLPENAPEKAKNAPRVVF